ncbi:MAG: DUF1987 domain-containing protein [Flavobacteriales bacterium]
MSSETLYIPGSEETPEVKLSLHDPNLVIAGRSFPENAHEFYQPVIDWVTRHGSRLQQPTVIEFRFDYFNSSSGRFIFEMLSQLEKLPKKALLNVVWTVEKGDELMLEKGLELKSLLDLQFEVREL